jgi:penicillin amidase
MPIGRKRRAGGLWLRIALSILCVAIILPVAALAGGWWLLHASLPSLDGQRAVAGLSAPVSVTRDAGGVPTLTATSRPDLARGLGFIHAQERFFQMDLLRRAGAGELSALVGPAALDVDRARRLHRFRARAGAVLASLPASDRALLRAYADGVNAGLAALGHAPWEYTLLRMAPVPWTATDTLLVVYAMYFDLQDSDPSAQLQSAAAITRLGPSMAAFLYPNGVPGDAPLDGTHLPEPAIPASRDPAAPAAQITEPPPTHGSNNFAVAGRLSETGAALVENDMHLDLRVPNIWFRARLMLPGKLDITGVTLPGVPFVVVGSNTHIAWAFTDSYIESGDAVVIDTLPGDPTSYKTPDGPRKIQVVPETICVAHGACETLNVANTIWGPIAGQDLSGRKIAWRWMAQDDNAVSITGFLGLENAFTVRQALDAAHTAGLPDQNFVVGDSAGHIAWTVIGQVPRRVGLTDQLPHDWADGAHGWTGYLSAAEIPEIIDPPDGRLWSANARMVGGKAYETLGNGGYAGPARARAIHDDLFARQHFSEADMLAIATDDRAHPLDPWQAILLHAIAADPHAAAMAPYVTAWGGRAVPDSVDYRLVRQFRGAAITRIYAGLAGTLAAAPGGAAPTGRNPDEPSLRLLAARPAALIPPPFKTWDALIQSALDAVRSDAEANAGLAHYRWGVRNHTAIFHPLSHAVPLLHDLTDPPDVPLAGDTLVPRVAIPGFGASERIVMSPGHEDRAIFDMPAGQAGNPLSPYYGAGEQDWVDGAATPLLPGPAKWTLHLMPQS